MKRLQQIAENASRQIARQTSRRGFLSRIGTLIVGGTAIPLLPVARAMANETKPNVIPKNPVGVSPQTSDHPLEEGDPTHCDYWRYCGIHGTLCTCCGGSPSACPPGSTISSLTWIGTCRNPVDDKNYIISYNDCCGKPGCRRCGCAPNNPADKPMLRPQSNGSDILWCFGAKSTIYTCSTAVVIGVALDQE